MNARTDHGTAQEAIDFALDELDDTWDRIEFLRAWRIGDLVDWEDFYEWRATLSTNKE